MLNRSMQYNRDIAKADKQENWHKLLKIWLDSKTYKEFIVAANVEVPKATKLQLFAFKAHHLAKEHPFLYSMAHLLFRFVVGFMSFAISTLVNEALINSVLNAAIVVVACELIWSYTVADSMKSIQWHEDGCPIDY